MAQTVIGFFEASSDAQRAIQRLENIGISRRDIDVSSSGSGGASTVGNDRRSEREEDRGNGITQFFNSIFGNNSNDAERYSSVGKSGYSIVTVHTQSREQAERVANILDECGAIDVDEKASQMGHAHARNDIPASQQNLTSERGQSIPRIQENLEVGKRTIEHGDVRVRSRIVERPVEEQVRLREERIHVERQPVDRPVSPMEMRNFQEGDIELIERAEVPVVNKEARVVEEVRVRKDVSERDEVIHDTIRHTEVDVDRLNRNEARQGRTDSDINGPRNL
jgi:stress response protein YsnF